MLLVGNPGIEHVGNHLYKAAGALGVQTEFFASERAYEAWLPVRKFYWHLREHRPPRLRSFSTDVQRACESSAVQCLLSTGVAPIDEAALKAIGRNGVVRMNFLTDDPWNPHHQCRWFMGALSQYDVIFSPRRSNIDQLRNVCARVEYLPFGYAPDIHFPQIPETSDEECHFTSDVMFAGGADPERVPYIGALIENGFQVAVYGGYWEKSRLTRSAARGFAGPAALRKAAACGRIALCLVRRANRDGHVMRTFELAAMGACILAEDTDDHRSVYGAEGTNVLYFRSIPEMLDRARMLLADGSLRERMRNSVRKHILETANTYCDRLQTILRAVN